MSKQAKHDLGWVLTVLAVGFMWTLPGWMIVWGWI